MEQRKYEEVQSNTSDNDRWEPFKFETDANYPKMCEGYYMGTRMQPGGTDGPFAVMTIAIFKDGAIVKDIDVAGGAVLGDKLDLVAVGTFVCIKYLGKKASKTQGRTYKDWQVFQDKNAIPYSQVTGAAPIKAAEIPATKTENVQQGTPPVTNNQFSAGKLPF